MEEIDNDKLLLEIIQLMRKMIANQELNAAFRLRLAEKLHHLIVMGDDFLCDEFDFSRKPKGKYVDR